MKKKLLIIATRHIGDLTSGADTRLINQLESIYEDYEIYVLHKSKKVSSKNRVLDFNISEKYFIRNVFEYDYNINFFNKIINKIFLKPTFYGKANWFSKVNQVINSIKPDVIQCDLFLASYYLPKNYRNISIAYGQDSLLRFSKSGFKNSKNLNQKFKFGFDILKYTLYEKCYQNYPVSVFVSEEDCIGFKKGNIKVVNLEVRLPKQTEIPDNNKLIFFGNLSYGPNEDSLIWLIETVLPKILRNDPSIKLIVAGSKITDKLKSYITKDEIIFIDTPKNMFSVIEEADLVLLPILWGSGQKNKILEAMACCRPIVCSNHAIEGINIENNKHVIVANDHEDYANKVVKLLGDKHKMNALINFSRDFVEGNFAAHVINEKYRAILNSI